jgi:hypothetical protein
LLLLFQVRQSGERQRQLIWLERLQEALFDLCIQGQSSHPLAVRSAKLALVGATPILRKFAPFGQRSANAGELHSAHSARSLALRLVLCVPRQAAPRDARKLFVRNCA